MYEHNQTLVPDSFLALYTAQGRPTRDRAFIEARHEMCEDLAQQTSDFCQGLQFSKDLTEKATLEKCRLGLLACSTAVTESETDWVICRVAELLNWPLPDHIVPATR